MTSLNKLILIGILSGVVCMRPDTAWAAQGSNVIAQAKVANGGVDACAASRQGQALIDCVADVMATFSANVNRGQVPSKAPEIVTVTSQAATIRGKKKPGALQVLNKVISITRELAAKHQGDFKPAYNAVAGVFTRALNVIAKKG